MKKCTKCGKLQPIENYIKRTDRRGHQSRCRACVALYNAERFRQRPDEVREAAREWYANNKPRAKLNNKEWRKANQRKRREYKHRRRQLLGSHDVISPARIEARLAAYGNKCWMCGSSADTIDHVKPLSKGGPHLLANLRPACRSCNSAKRDHWPGPAGLEKFIRRHRESGAYFHARLG